MSASNQPLQVSLVSSDDVEFTIEYEAVKCSELIKNLVEDCPDFFDEDPLQLPDIKGDVLDKVLEWCRYHAGEADGPQSAESAEWDRNFIDLDNDVLHAIILAADGLGIKALLDLGCRAVAEMIRGKSPASIRRLLSIDNDFTAAEEAAVRRDNEWAEER